jgi:hypothetical protein
VAMLVQALAKGKGELDTATVAETQEIILSGLRDPDHGIRGKTIRALGKFGGDDMIPALRASADADTSNDAGSRSLRRRTLQAIAAIQQREGHEKTLVEDFTVIVRDVHVDRREVGISLPAGGLSWKVVSGNFCDHHSLKTAAVPVESRCKASPARYPKQ